MRSSTKSTKKPTRQARNTKNSRGSAQSRARTGSGGLRARKAFNWARALPLIAILTLAGGFMVYQSYAAEGTAEQVESVYLELLGRRPDTAGHFYWTDQLNQGKSINVVKNAIMATEEYKKYQATLKAAATTPTPQSTPPTTSGSAASVAASKGLPTHYAGGTAIPGVACSDKPLNLTAQGKIKKICEDRVKSLYRQLLGRDPDSSASYWVDQLYSGGKSLADVTAQLKNTAEYKKRQAALAEEAKNFVDEQGGISDELYIARACFEIMMVDCNKEDSKTPSGNKKWTGFEEQFYELLKTGLTREEVYKRMVESAFGASRTAEYRSRPQHEEGVKKRQEWNDWMYNLQQELGIATTNPYGHDELPFREDYCLREESAYLEKTQMYYDHTGICIKAAGYAYDVDFYRQWAAGEITLAQIETIIKTGDPGKVGAVMACNETLASIIPECGGGALSVPKESVDSLLKEKQEERLEIRRQAEELGKKPTKEKPIDISDLTKVTNDITKVTKPVDLALATTPVTNAPLPVPTSLQNVARIQKVMGKATNIEAEIVESITFTECMERKIDLSLGDAGPCVSYIQEALALASGDEAIAATGFYDEDTANAVMRFQQGHNVSAETPGNADVNTVSLLSRAVMPKQHKSPYAPASGTLVNNR